MKTKQQKITSVNFVPPLIHPYKYDPQVVRDTVASTIAKAETADEQAAAEPTAGPGRPGGVGPGRHRQGDEAEEAGRHGPPGHRPGRQHQRPGEHLLGRLTAAAGARHPARRM